MKKIKKFDNRDLICLLGLMFKHVGFKNYISTSKIISYLSDRNIKIKPRSLPQYIRVLSNKFRLRIGYKRGCGYFIISSKEDLDIIISDLDNQIKSLTETINLLLSLGDLLWEREM